MTALAVLALALSLPPLAAQEGAAAPDSEPDARLSRIEGTVYVHLADLPEDEFVAAKKDSPLQAGDHVRTGTDGRAEVAFNDESVIELAPNSDFLISSLDPKASEVYLGIGSLVAKLKKLLPGREMRFHTPTAVAAVRGTELGISQEGDERAVVGVFDEGEVAVRSDAGKEEVILKPNQETEVRRGGPPGAARALKVLEARRDRLQDCRKRFDRIGKDWKPRPRQARLELRRGLAAAKRYKGEALRKVSPELRQRRYQDIKQRLERRQEGRQGLKERRAPRGRQRAEEKRRQRDQRRDRAERKRQRRERAVEEIRGGSGGGEAGGDEPRRRAAPQGNPPGGTGGQERPRRFGPQGGQGGGPSPWRRKGPGGQPQQQPQGQGGREGDPRFRR